MKRLINWWKNFRRPLTYEEKTRTVSRVNISDDEKARYINGIAGHVGMPKFDNKNEGENK